MPYEDSMVSSNFTKNSWSTYDTSIIFERKVVNVYVSQYLIRHLLHFRGRIWICVHIFGQEANEHLKLGHYMFPKCKRKIVRSIFVALEIKRCLQKIQMRLFNHSLSTTTAQLARRESNLENYRIALTLICFYGHIN